MKNIFLLFLLGLWKLDLEKYLKKNSNIYDNNSKNQLLLLLDKEYEFVDSKWSWRKLIFAGIITIIFTIIIIIIIIIFIFIG